MTALSTFSIFVEGIMVLTKLSSCLSVRLSSAIKIELKAIDRKLILNTLFIFYPFVFGCLVLFDVLFLASSSMLLISVKSVVMTVISLPAEISITGEIWSAIFK